MRNDLAVVCAAIGDRLDLVAGALSDQAETLEAVKALAASQDAHAVQQLEVAEQQLARLQLEAGLPVRLQTQAGPVSIDAPEGVSVANPTDTEPLEQATVQVSETVNAELWAIFGCAVGVLLLVWVFRMVRP